MLLPEYDPTELLSEVDNDPVAFEHILTLFQQSYDSHLKAIQTAILEKSAKNLKFSVHALKNEVLTLRYNPSSQSVIQLEERVATGNLEGSQILFENIKLSIEPILRFILNRKK